MAKVTNLAPTSTILHRWISAPNSSTWIDMVGKSYEELPDDVGYSVEAKRLADLGILSIEGYSQKKETVSAPEVVPEVQEETPPYEEARVRRRRG